MKDSSIRSVAAEWLEERILPELVERDGRPVNFGTLSHILAVVGPRRAGKTFYMYQLIKQLESSGISRQDILFIDFEDYRLSQFEPSDFDKFLSTWVQFTGRKPTYLFFDEVQHIPGWSRFLRTLHSRGNYKIIVSGSNSNLLSSEISTELRGRYISRIMLPLSFAEVLRFKGVEITPAAIYSSSRGNFLRVFSEYLEEGGFPEILAHENRLEKRELLQTYYKVMFYKDLLERHHIKARANLEIMMNYCIDTFADLFSISSFEKHLRESSLSMSKKSISNYLQYIRDAFFFILTEKFSPSPRKRLMNPKKVYLMDIGFASLGMGFSENLGKRLENVVAVEYFRRGENFYYYKNHQECDFIVMRAERPALAVQVTWELNRSSEKRELSGLREAMRSLGIQEGLVLTYDQEEDFSEDGAVVKVVPVWKWMLEDRPGDK
jgi:predicted AAA+ superfamily ATPase